MENSASIFHATTDTNPYFLILEEDLSRSLSNLTLHTTAITNTNLPTSSSTSPQFQIPRNTQLTRAFDDHVEAFPSTPFMPEDNGSPFRLNQGIGIQELQNPDAILDSFVMKAMNEIGSMEVQEYLKMKKPEFTDPIFEKLMEKSQVGVPYFLHLMVNQHGSYVFKQLIDACDWPQLVTIVTHITRYSILFGDICLARYGACSTIKLIKVLKKSPLASYLVLNLAVHFDSLMLDKSGLYVISECLDQLGETENCMLYRSAIMYCLIMATHKYGCILLNAFIEKIGGPLREVLMDEICKCAVYLAFDPSGNYVVQKVLDMENPVFTHRIIMNLRGKYACLSRQKAGSHLVEKCLNSTGMMTVAEELIRTNQVLSLAEHKFGNYVIQTAYNVTKVTAHISKLHSALVGCLYPYLSRLKNGYGKNVYNLIAQDILLCEAVQPWKFLGQQASKSEEVNSS